MLKTSLETVRLIRDGEKGGGVWRWGEREIIYLSLHCHHQNAGIKMEGFLYLQKYGIGGPDFGIKEECITEKGRHLLEKL